MPISKLFLAGFLLLLSTILYGQEKPAETEEEYDQTYEWRIRQAYLNEVYIPGDLADAFKQLNQLIDQPSREKFKTVGEEQAARKLHFSLGRWIIVNWGLYEGSRLSQYLKNIGLFHPDDMARFVIITYHRNLNRKSLEVKELVEHLQQLRKDEEKKKLEGAEILHEETRIRPKN